LFSKKKGAIFNFGNDTETVPDIDTETVPDKNRDRVSGENVQNQPFCERENETVSK